MSCFATAQSQGIKTLNAELCRKGQEKTREEDQQKTTEQDGQRIRPGKAFWECKTL